MTIGKARAALGKLAGLARQLPGVTVTWEQVGGNVVRLGLLVTDGKALARLAHLAAKANCLLAVEPDWECNGVGCSNPWCVRYDLRVSRTSLDVVVSEMAQLVGPGGAS